MPDGIRYSYNILHWGDTARVSMRHVLSITQEFVQKIIKDNNAKDIKTLHTWPYVQRSAESAPCHDVFIKRILYANGVEIITAIHHVLDDTIDQSRYFQTTIHYYIYILDLDINTARNLTKDINIHVLSNVIVFGQTRYMKAIVFVLLIWYTQTFL